MTHEHISHILAPETTTLDVNVAPQIRHANKLTVLMGERADLRGVVPLADLVDESVRWSA